MRLSPNGRRLAYVAGKGERPANPIVTVRDDDGTLIALAPGHSPRWAAPDLVVFGPQDVGPPLQFAAPPSWAVANYDVAAGNSVTAAAGRVAVHLTNPPQVLCSWRAPIAGATDPVLSDDGEWLAYLLPDQPPGLASLWVERADGQGAPRNLAVGALSKPRFGGRTLTWQAGSGTIGGCADVANPHVDPITFPLPAWHAYEPVPVWVPIGSALLVLFLADRGPDAEILLAEWGSLAEGSPVGWALGVSTGSGYEHEAKPVDGGPAVAVWFFGPGAEPVRRDLDVRGSRAWLEPPTQVAPEPPPPVPPDIPWQSDLSKTVDVSPFIDRASTARKDLEGDRCIWWLKKSPERPDWGEWWHADGDYIGLLEDRSTAYRKVWKDGKLLRLSPEEVVAGNAAGLNYGDPFTLPLHSYTLRPFSLWMPRRFTGRFERAYRTDYVWHEWEHWPNLPIRITAEAGFGRFNGHEVHMRMSYGKADGSREWNYFGQSAGWTRFENWFADGTEEVGARRTAPPEATGAEKGPFVEPRFQPVYPIVGEPVPEPEPPQEPEPMQLPTDEQMVNAMRRIHVEGYIGELQRSGGIFDSPSPQDAVITDIRRPGVYIDDYSLSVWTGRYVRFFADVTGTNVDRHEFAIRAVLRLLHDSDEARQKRGERPTPPPTPGALRGPIGVDGRDFTVPQEG